MNISFEGKRILITGAGRGIGRGLALALAKSSPKVTVIGIARTQANLDSLKAEAKFGNIETISVDLGDWHATRKAVQSVLPIDGVVNNAGIYVDQTVLGTTPEMFDELFNTNVKAVINVCQVVAEDLIKRKVPGSIVNMSSQASQAALTNHLLYSGTKGALDIMTKVMALEFGPYNIRCNCIQPTVILTEMGKAGSWADPGKEKWMLERIPLGKFAQVEDMFGAIFLLLSDKSDMITGTCIPVDGGFLAQ